MSVVLFSSIPANTSAPRSPILFWLKFKLIRVLLTSSALAISTAPEAATRPGEGGRWMWGGAKCRTANTMDV